MKESCSSISKLLEKYFDQEVMDEERLLVEAHLQDCLVCQELLRSMEELRILIKVPVEKAVQQEDFPWVWQKIEREIRLQKKPFGWPSLRSWLDVSPFLKKKIWIPTLAMAVLLLVITTQFFDKKTPSFSGISVVEYVESKTNNVMVYKLENSKVTVIWVFEEPEQETATTI